MRVGFLHCLSLAVAVACASLAWAESGAPLRLAALAPLTGDWGSYGQEIKDGVELVAKKLNASGTPVKIFYEDACLPAAAVASLRKLISADKIQGIVASYCVIGMDAMQPIIESAKIPAFHTSPVSDSIVNGGTYVFTTNVVVGSEAMELARYARSQLKAKSAYTLYLETQWGLDYAKHFSEEFERLGGKILGQSSDLIGVNDFRTELVRVRALNPDIIFAVHVGPNLGNMLRQARQLGLKQIFIGPDEVEDPTVLETAGVAAEGLRFISPVALVANQVVTDFQKEFNAQYHFMPGTLAANAYDATMLAAQALQACAGEGTCARDRLYKTQNYEGTSGQFSIRSDGGTEKGYLPKMVKHGKFVAID